MASSVNKSYKTVTIIFIFLSLIILVGTSYFGLAQARVMIKVFPHSTIADFPLTINLDEDNELITGLNGKLYDITVSKTVEQNVQPTPISDTKTGGIMNVVNEYSREQKLVRTTRFLASDGKLYRTVSDITVPGKTTVKVKVLADKDGVEQAVPAGTKFIIPGLWVGLQDKIYGEASSDFNISTEEVQIVSQTDIDNAAQAGVAQLTQEALASLKGNLKPSETLNPSLAHVTVIKGEPAENVGTETQVLHYNIELRVQAIAIDEEDLLAAVNTEIQTYIPQDNNLLPIKVSDLEIILGELNDSSVSVRISGKASYTPSALDDLLDRSELTGKSKDDIKTIVENHDGMVVEKIEFRPAFRSKSPQLTGQIKITATLAD